MSEFNFTKNTVSTVSHQPPAFIKDSSGITIFYNEKSYIISKSHRNYEKIISTLKDKNYDNLYSLLNVVDNVKSYSDGKINIVNGEVFYDGEVFHNVMVERLLSMMDEGFDINHLIKFMNNLLDNPSKTSIDELYLFLESGNLPITEDGHFLAYKLVRHDFYDIFSGKFDHSPGKIISMKRNEVDDNRHRTCSTGFHFCSISYLPSYSKSNDNRVVIVKINPRDVVSIPSDYRNTKGRTCRYEVVGEYTGDWRNGISAFNDRLVVNERSTSDVKFIPVTEINSTKKYKNNTLRDPVTGRFVARYSTRWYELGGEDI